MIETIKIPFSSLSLSESHVLLQLTNGYYDADSQSIIIPIPDYLLA